MPVAEALTFFERQPAILRHIQSLSDVGLGYVRLGQPAPTLSGARPSASSWHGTGVARPVTRSTCWTSRRRTTFRRREASLGGPAPSRRPGNTVLVIEHNLDVVKTADWVIDLGPRADVAEERLSRGHARRDCDAAERDRSRLEGVAGSARTALVFARPRHPAPERLLPLSQRSRPDHLRRQGPLLGLAVGKLLPASGGLSHKTQALMAEATSVEWIVTPTELDALVSRTN